MYKNSKVIQKAESINETRKGLFLSKGFALEKLPPTKDTLTEKIKRCVYQSALWRQSLIKDPYMPVSTHWGWTINDNDGKHNAQETVLVSHVKLVVLHYAPASA